MSDDQHDDAEVAWLLEPPGSGQVHVSIAIGSEVDLSPDALAAIDTLMSGLQESEVSGFALGLEGLHPGPCPTYRICNPYQGCQPLETFPCVRFVHCRIGNIG